MLRIKHVLRRLVRAPGFTVTSVLTLAIGIGACTAIFNVVNSVLIEPLPYPEADELVAVWHEAPGAPGIATVSGGLRPSPSMYFTYADENRSFESIGLWDRGMATVTGLERPEELRTIGVTDGVFQALAVPAVVGRWLAEPDMTPGGPLRIVLANGYWEQRFGGAADVVGRTLTVNGEVGEIVGVMPEGFRIADVAADLYLPARIDRSTLTLPPFCCQVVARLAPGVTLEQANADVARMVTIWTQAWPYQGDGRFYEDVWQITPALRLLKQDVVGEIGALLWVVAATIGAVLLIACANVTSLMLVRAESRKHELVVRAALGAGTWRLAREVVLEAVSIALCGGVIGVMLAYAGLELLLSLNPADLPRLAEVSLDATAIGFALVLSLMTGVLVGLVAIGKGSARRLSAALAVGGRNTSQGRGQHRLQNALVIAQVAFALVLLVCSGLMIRTVDALRDVEPGFTTPESLQTLRITIPPLVESDPEAVARMQHDIVDSIAATPGVESVAFASSVPLAGTYTNWDGIDVEGQPRDPGAGSRTMRTFKSISPGLFETAGTRIVAGRDLTWDELHELRPVAMISANLARELWGAPSAALGRRIRVMEDTPWREIVGVVEDVRENGLHEPAPTIVYWPSLVANFYAGAPWYLPRTVTLVVRSPIAGSLALAEQLQRAVRSVNPDIPAAAMQTMQEIYDRSLARTAFALVMLGISSAVALALGVVGLYGVLSYALAQRRREIAIRLALGEQPRALEARLVRSGVALAGIGAAIGLAAAAAVTPLLGSLLFDVGHLDPSTYALVTVTLLAVAALASYLPARRASTVPPVEALAAQ